MKLNQRTATLFIPDATPETEALSRITHLGIGAHQDDLEFMAYHGILECFGNDAQWFGGVTCTNGAGSARTGPYARCTDERMREIRRQEQDTAALVGGYAAMFQLDYPSGVVKDPQDTELTDDLVRILSSARPEVVYTHNPADKHDTHIGVLIAALGAMRELPPGERPKRVIGCEVWRNLDWLPDEDKVVMDVSGHPNLAAALNGVFDSQIAGGKRYDLAATGRRAANATFLESHATDQAQQVILGLDLTRLVQDDSCSIVDHVCGLVDKFNLDVRGRLSRRLGNS